MICLEKSAQLRRNRLYASRFGEEFILRINASSCSGRVATWNPYNVRSYAEPTNSYQGPDGSSYFTSCSSSLSLCETSSLATSSFGTGFEPWVAITFKCGKYWWRRKVTNCGSAYKGISLGFSTAYRYGISGIAIQSYPATP